MPEISAGQDLPEDRQSEIDCENCEEEMNHDTVLGVVEQFDCFQRILYFLLWLPAAGMSIGVYASVFLEYSPKFGCEGDNMTTFSSNCSSECSSYVYDDEIFTSTVVTKWDLVCSSASLTTLSSTISMSGMLVGSFFFGWLGDKIGRKTTFAVTTASLILGSIASALSPIFPVYVASRFITSCGGVGLFITSFVLALEFVGTKFRTACGIALMIPFALGELYLVLLAYYIRDWQVNQFVIGASFLVYLVYLLWIPESLRWQLSTNKIKKAKEVLSRIAFFNGITVPDLYRKIASSDSENDDLLQTSVSNEASIDNPVGSKCTDKVNDTDFETEYVESIQSSSFNSLFFDTVMRKRLMIMGLNWTAASLAFYGLSLNSANLGDNPFSNFALSATAEIPSYVFCILCIDRLGRRFILGFSQILGGVTCILAGCLSAELQTLQMALSLVGKFGASASFGIVFVFTAELFPTPVRNSSVGFCSTLARIGSMLAPSIAKLSVLDPRVPFSVMGIFCVLAGLLSYFLPETSGQPLCNTVDEAKKIGVKKV